MYKERLPIWPRQPSYLDNMMPVCPTFLLLTTCIVGMCKINNTHNLKGLPKHEISDCINDNLIYLLGIRMAQAFLKLRRYLTWRRFPNRYYYNSYYFNFPIEIIYHWVIRVLEATTHTSRYGGYAPYAYWKYVCKAVPSLIAISIYSEIGFNK